MTKKLLFGLLVALVSLKFTVFSQEIHQYGGSASELHIKGFKESFGTLSPEQQSAIVSEIINLGKQFEATLDSADYYISLRDRRIAELKNTPVTGPEEKHTLNRDIINEYIHVNFDSALDVGKHNLELAQSIGRTDLIANSRIDLTNIFIQGGYFREAVEQLDSIDMAQLDDDHRAEALLARYFLEFENGFFFAWNRQNPDISEIRMRELYQELISLLPDDDYDIYRLKSTLAFYKHRYVDATGYCDILLLKNSNPDSWDYIAELGNMGYNKLGAHDYVAAMDYMVKSATLAMRKGAVNNPALRKIAELLYVVGNDKLASKFINKSMDYAMDYNSKYRIIESAKGYPMINRHLQERIERNHRTMIIVAIIMAILVIMLTVSLWYSRKQHQKVNRQAAIISEYNDTLKERNKEIESVNAKLSEIHGVTGTLASKMMNGASIRRELVEKLRKDVALKLKVRQYDDLPAMIENFRKEMKENQTDIDEILLAFFPTFLEQFNKLLKEENRFESKNGMLPPEVRIFALWRIGLRKNESIARCMAYSLNTIKSYKTKVINSSLYEKDEFYSHLMDIRVVVSE